jgi:hypothetical protein
MKYADMAVIATSSAYGDLNGSVTHALLLTPVPEPAAPAALFILTALLGVGSRPVGRRIQPFDSP